MNHEPAPDKAAQRDMEVPTNQEKALSPPDVAKIMGVTPPAVHGWIQKGLLPATQQPNGFWQIKTVDVERFVKAWSAGVRRHAFVEGPAEVRAAVERLGFIVIQAKNVADALSKLASSRQ